MNRHTLLLSNFVQRHSKLLLSLTILCAAPVAAQTYSGIGTANEVFVGSEAEAFLRNLSLSDTSSPVSWSIRPLSRSEIRRVARFRIQNPWQSRITGFADAAHSIEGHFLSPNASVRFNSAYPYGSNDGAIWAGRGITVSAQAGVFGRIGPLSITLLPIVFDAQNSSFDLAPSGLPCGCGNPFHGNSVDRPQRFGDGAYRQFDPGQSSVRLDVAGAVGGFSTANEGWGPSSEYPFLLGNNAPGFPHIFAGSSSPFPIFIGRLHARVIYGRLDQSSYSPVTGSKYYSSRLEPGRVRFASGLIASFQPRGLDGFEVGFARFTHSVWPRTGIPPSYLKKPFQALLKSHLGSDFEQRLAGTDNELASLFARWAFKEARLEIYGEYGREDHSYDLRDLIQEPDHQRSYSLGFAKTTTPRANEFSVLRVELMNFQLSPLATTTRGEGGIYTHTHLPQGHTNRGQLLGADIGVGAAAGSTVRWDHYSTGGRWALFWRRNLRQESDDSFLDNPGVPQGYDVLHAFGYERLRFTRKFDVTTAVTLMRDFSRNYGRSLSNLNMAFAITLPR
jgi:hypothetical protein